MSHFPMHPRSCHLATSAGTNSSDARLHAYAGRVRWFLIAPVVLGMTTLVARAAELPPKEVKKIDIKRAWWALAERPHVTFELEAGILALPNAAISVANRGGQTPFGAIGRGDATVHLGTHILYRAGESWAIGAHGYFAPAPTRDDSYQVNEGKVRREHSRSYLSLGFEARYYPLTTRYFEVFLSAAVSGVVIADRFTQLGLVPVPTILGKPDVTVRTEGVGLGGGLGVLYRPSANWNVGLLLRAESWFLPGASADPRNEASCTAIGDCRTMTGTNFAMMLGLNAGYRIR